MKKIIRILIIISAVITATNSFAQCGPGYNQVTLNWDFLDYFSYTGNYTSTNGYLPSNTFSSTQNFAFGTQRVTIVHNYDNNLAPGENTTNTADSGAYGTGADVQFIGDGTVTFTFDNAVQNVKFSVFDIDKSQIVTITALNGVTPADVTVAKIQGTTLTIAGTSTAPTATANSLTVSNSNEDGTINIDISGPITSFTVTVTSSGTCSSRCGTGGSEGGSYWISDITACSAGSFTSNYYNVSKPFTGQAAYVLHSFDKSVYAVNIATGFTRFLFTDNTSPFGGSSYINSMAYDPYKRVLYYVYSLTGSPSTNKTLKKYDFNTGTISTVLSNITSTTLGTGVGIPVTNYAGVESGAAAFYDGSLYIGIETSDNSRNTGREAVIWRIDFNAGNVPYRASQVFATPADNGSGTLVHDWADFAINDGILYDFDGAGVTTQTDVTHFNLITGNVTNFPLPSWTPGQIAVAWNNNLYQLYATTIDPTVNPYLALYNGTGGIGTQMPIISSPMYTPAIPSLGDAAEAFRWPVDFGDAPPSYDPAGSDPGVNEISSNLYLGVNKDSEFVSRGQTPLANSDNYDDGLPGGAGIFSPAYGNYLTQVNVFNNTGANATVAAWLDYNGNSLFDASEGITVNVPTSTSTQSVYLYWPSAPSTLVNGTYTYLRIRVTSASNGITTSNPTGYFNNGEIEDYRVPVNTYPLAIQLISFDAQKTADQKVNLQWQAANEQINTKYGLQRSSDMQGWISIQTVTAVTVNANHVYTDANPLTGTSFYRLKMQESNGAITYSQIKKIEFNDRIRLLLAPNPAFNTVKLSINNGKSSIAHLQITNMSGKLVHQQNLVIQRGANVMTLSFVEKLTTGIYTVQLEMDNKIYNEKLVVKK